MSDIDLLEFDKYIEVPEADTMPLERWTAYMTSKAISLGYHGRYTLDKPNHGHSRLKIYKQRFH